MVATGEEWFNEEATPEIRSCGSTGITAKVFPRCFALGFRFLPLLGYTASDFLVFRRPTFPLFFSNTKGSSSFHVLKAKRLMTRVDQFREVILDFKGITSIGQAFADEVFRIYRREHPSVHISPVNMIPEVQGMIQRSIAGNPDDPLHEYFRRDIG